ncbi:copper amine oxidase N-terminal domain-containing protein [Brevibacillus thermoruber]|uniref:Copper amine oxidase N-terminal domain-containing protein n=1 Tax=Brevibacillus thermoruber TaxID=33942 RepID=A0A9X3TTZ8_9BACL|nr:copper amine oxidase N-terminal domain-containing protein [Brevibacillus thermoruber]MDA5110379.1 copper amine oxidase N-terminal domain-containing protein [Brevibacillus thermoruber]
MKKIVTASLTAALMLGAVPAALAQTEGLADRNTAAHGDVQGENAAGGAAGTADEAGSDTSASTDDQSTADTPSQTESDTTTSPATTSDQSPTTLSVQEAVQSAEKLNELRQQLKDAPEVTEQVAATYEELVNALVDIADLPQAIEVQKELLERTYQPGDTEPFQKLGQLYAKANVTDVKTFVNGEELTMDQAPFIVGGRALVTERVIREALDADVRWDEAAGAVTVTRGDRTITLHVNKNEAETNGNKITTDAIPVVKNGSLYLPIRFISEQLEATVDWQKDGQIIIIDDNQVDESQPAGLTAPDATNQTDGGTSGTDNSSGSGTSGSDDGSDDSTDASNPDQSADTGSSDSDDSADSDSSNTDDSDDAADTN